MQRIGDLTKWTSIRDGESLEFARDVPRTIRLEVNSAAPLSLYVSPLSSKEGEGLQFLSVSEGLDLIEFAVPGAFRLTAEGNGYVHTKDGTHVHVEKTDERVFAKIAERKPRNYQLELAMRIAAENQNKRFKALIDEQERLLEERLKNVASVAPAPASGPKGDEGSARKKPGKAGGSGQAPEAAEQPGGVDDGSGEA